MKLGAQVIGRADEVIEWLRLRPVGLAQERPDSTSIVVEGSSRLVSTYSRLTLTLTTIR